MICTLLLGLTAFSHPTLPAQEPPTFKRDQLSLTTYKPHWIDAGELHAVAEEMFGRRFIVDERMIQNLNLLYDSLLIYDTPEECARIVNTLSGLEQSMEDAEDTSGTNSGLPLVREIPLLDFRLRSMDLGSAMQALAPYQREVAARDESGEYVSFSNIQALDDSLFLLRDTQENLSAMRALLEKLDQPPPQVTINAWVLHGSEIEAPSVLPAGLGKNLEAMLPGMSFEIATRGMLQTSAAPGHSVQLRMRGAFLQNYELSLITGPYDAKNGRMSLESCEFFERTEEETEQLFETSTVLVQGEYAVIGLTGADPVLLVLRLTPLP